MRYIVKLSGKKKIEYKNIGIQYNDNGVFLIGKNEEMFIPYGNLEYIIRSDKECQPISEKKKSCTQQ